jgi:type IV secretory pathway VirB2 component (pilin)
MKIISRILLIFILSFWAFNINTNAWFFSDLITEAEPKVHIDCEEQECNLLTWTNIVRDSVTWIEKERTLSQYIQDIVVYLLGFLSIIAVLYIIYAWFRILVWAGEEETLKKQKGTILYVIIWLAVIWLAYPIVLFIVNILNQTPTQ